MLQFFTMAIPLDFTLLTTARLLLFALSFVAVFGLFSLLLTFYPRLLRAHHSKPVYFGGVLLIGAMTVLAYFTIEDPTARIGLLAAAFLILLVGIVDEQQRLSARTQFIWQLVIAVVAGSWGWSISEISNPWHEGVISLAWGHLGLFVLPGGLLAVLWLVFLMNAINWLDGVDGLAGGVGVMTFLALAAVSLLPSIQDAHSLQLALIGAGAALGFLLWNFSPAKIYLGTSGSWFLGLFIGMVAMLGGGKIVTTLLVLALPVIDVALVLLSRLWAGKSLWQGEQARHLHYRLLAARLSPRLITVGAMLVTAALGVAAITLQTQQKMAAFGMAGGVMIVILLGLVYKQTHTS